MAPATKICFLGSDPIVIPLLEFLADSPEVDLRAVFTQPDRRSGRGKKRVPNVIGQWVRDRALELRQPEKPLPETAEWIQREGIELAFVMAYGQLLSKSILEAPRRGMWNFHGSLLPELRGASPLETALAEGKSETGVTLMGMVKKMDAGPIADQIRIPIHSRDLASDLRQRAGLACPALLQRNLEALCNGTCTTTPQDPGAVTYCRRLCKEDGFLDFSQPAEVLERRHRACQPWPGSFFDYEGQRLKVGRLKVEAEDLLKTLPPGRLFQNGARLLIGTVTRPLDILELQRPGGKWLETPDFLRGFSLKSGTQLQFPASKPWVAEKPF